MRKKDRSVSAAPEAERIRTSSSGREKASSARRLPSGPLRPIVYREDVALGLDGIDITRTTRIKPTQTNSVHAASRVDCCCAVAPRRLQTEVVRARRGAFADERIGTFGVRESGQWRAVSQGHTTTPTTTSSFQSNRSPCNHDMGHPV